MAIHSVSADLENPNCEMAGHEVPRVKFPDTTSSNSVIPGPNSWAQREEHREGVSQDIQPTNRDRYENKPLPEISSETFRDSVMEQRGYIEPAIPLLSTLPRSHKHRAVTDPVQVRALLAARKPSVSHLKKKGKIFEFSSSKVDVSSGSELPHPNIPPKALELLGVEQKLTTTPLPVPSQTRTPASIRHSADDGTASPPKLVRQALSDQAATRVSSSELEAKTTFTGASKTAGKQSLNEQVRPNSASVDFARPSHIQQDNSKEIPRPPKVAPYANAGKQCGVIQQQVFHPSGSFHGVIETVSPAHTEERDVTNFDQYSTPTRCLQHEPSGEILRPAIYSPNFYNGVWENDPAVVGAYLPGNL